MNVASRNQLSLFVLVFLAFVPAIGLYVFASGAARESAIAERENELLQFAHVSAVQYERFVDESESLLGALTEFPEVANGGLPCSRRLAAVLRHTSLKNAIYTSVEGSPR